MIKLLMINSEDLFGRSLCPYVETRQLKKCNNDEIIKVIKDYKNRYKNSEGVYAIIIDTKDMHILDFKYSVFFGNLTFRTEQNLNEVIRAVSLSEGALKFKVEFYNWEGKKKVMSFSDFFKMYAKINDKYKWLQQHQIAFHNENDKNDNLISYKNFKQTIVYPVSMYNL